MPGKEVEVMTAKFAMDGRIRLPAKAREALGVVPGDVLVFFLRRDSKGIGYLEVKALKHIARM